MDFPMSLAAMSLILVGTFLFLLLIGVEIFASIGLAACVGLLLFMNQSVDQFAYTAWATENTFTFTAIPLFVFMGSMFSNTGVIRVLFAGAEKLIGFLPGGLAVSTIGAGAVFGAMSGSSIAAAATFGQIAFPEMEKTGYDPKLAFGSIAMGGALSVLIPPSVVLIVYGGWQEVSVPRLFAGGLIPGILLALLFILTVIIMVKLNPRLAPKPVSFSWRERLFALRDIIPWLGIVVLVLGVIFAGIMTPTEAAALGAFLGIAVALGYRQLSFDAVKKSALTAVRISAMIALIITMARVLGHIFQVIGLTEAFSSFVLDLGWGKYGVLIILYGMYIILGCFMDGISMMTITLPFVIPIIEGVGWNLVWWGVVYVVVDELALVTPPYGLNLFAIRGVVPQYSIFTVALGALPFYPAVLITLALCTAFPQIVMWLPNLMF